MKGSRSFSFCCYPLHLHNCLFKKEAHALLETRRLVCDFYNTLPAGSWDFFCQHTPDWVQDDDKGGAFGYTRRGNAENYHPQINYQSTRYRATLLSTRSDLQRPYTRRLIGETSCFGLVY